MTLGTQWQFPWARAGSRSKNQPHGGLGVSCGQWTQLTWIDLLCPQQDKGPGTPAPEAGQRRSWLSAPDVPGPRSKAERERGDETRLLTPTGQRAISTRRVPRAGQGAPLSPSPVPTLGQRPQICWLRGVGARTAVGKRSQTRVQPALRRLRQPSLRTGLCKHRPVGVRGAGRVASPRGGHPCPHLGIQGVHFLPPLDPPGGC